MSNQQNDIVLEQCGDYVRQKMNDNPTIPEEAFGQLVKEEFEKRCDMPIEDEMDDDSGDEPPFESPTADQIAQNEE